MKSIQRSEGKYVWLLGDDDIPKKNCLQNLLEVLDKNTDTLHPSSNEYDMIYNDHTNLKKDSDYLNDVIKANPHLFLATTFITICVFKQNAFDFDIVKNYSKTLCDHSYAIACNKNCSVTIET